MDYDGGYVGLEEKTLQPLDNPFGLKCYLCLRNNLLPMCPDRTLKFIYAARRSYCAFPRFRKTGLF